MAGLTGNIGIKGFLETISNNGGVAFSNTYEVRFDGISNKLRDELRQAGFNAFNYNVSEAITALTLQCEEASLPGMMANTGQTVGRYMGEGQVNYAHTKSFQDMTLGWTCDANLLPLKFLNTWLEFIFPDNNPTNGRYSTTRLNYPEDYMCKELIIVKGERGGYATGGRGNSKGNTLQRVGGTYKLYDAWPYAIQSTPVSYGSSQLLKVTASFYYRRWGFEGGNASKV
jgi:hypothetical protein